MTFLFSLYCNMRWYLDMLLLNFYLAHINISKHFMSTILNSQDIWCLVFSLLEYWASVILLCQNKILGASLNTLRLPLVTFGYLSIPFLTIPYHFLHLLAN